MQLQQIWLNFGINNRYLAIKLVVGWRRIAKFGLKKLKISFHGIAQTTNLDVMNRLGMTHRCDKQVDGRTDIFVAYAALSYVVRPKTTNYKLCYALILKKTGHSLVTIIS